MKEASHPPPSQGEGGNGRAYFVVLLELELELLSDLLAELVISMRFAVTFSPDPVKLART